MTLQEQYEGWDEINYIHGLQNDANFVEMILQIAEYGAIDFFHNYGIFLEEVYGGHRHYQDMIWDQAFEFFIHPHYSQLWRGIELTSVERKRMREYKNKYEWYDQLVMGQTGRIRETPLKGRKLTDIFK